MSHSAYAPPSADLRTDVDDLGSGSFEIGRCLAEAWSDTWANFGLWLGVMLVGGVAMMLSILTLVGIVFLVPVLAWGLTRFYLGMRDGTATFGDMFSGFACYGRALGGMLLFGIAWSALSMPGQVIAEIGSQTENLAAQLVGLVLNLCTILFLPRLAFAPLLMVDRELGGADALARSWQLTAPVKWKMIGLVIIHTLLILAGLVVFLVGVIPASVMAYLTIVSAYRQVVGGPVASSAV